MVERISQPEGQRRGQLPLHGIAASTAIEAAALAAHPDGHLMQRAGLAVAKWLLALAPEARRVWVPCGSGYNGGDGLVAARHLAQAGLKVEAWLPSKLARARGPATDSGRPAPLVQALEEARSAGVQISAALPTLPRADVALDALLGFPTRKAPEGEIAAALRTYNSAAQVRLALDVPSGLCADSGRALGTDVAQAHHCLSLLTLKPGLFTAHGRDAAGYTWCDRLGCQDFVAAHTPDALLLRGDEACSRERLHGHHKGSFGDVAVVGGASGMVGAAVLAARAALSSACGRVFLSLLDPHPLAIDIQEPGLMLRGHWWLQTRSPLAQATVLAGCGGDQAIARALPALLQQASRLVLDADALNAVSRDDHLKALLKKRSLRSLPTVMTPHPLEAARLLGQDAAQVQRDRRAAAQSLARTYGCTVVLKGTGTVTAAPNALPVLNASGNALLATGGTGDVLAGWLAGLWAQHPDIEPLAVASAAAWQHGAAADVVRARGQLRLSASALIQELALLR